MRQVVLIAHKAIKDMRKGRWQQLKEYAKGFYKSKAWKNAREQAIMKANGLCERCKAKGIYKPGYIVHHKKHITPGNINDKNITLNVNNLEYVCEDCHNKEHKAKGNDRYCFDSNGNILPPKQTTPPSNQNLRAGERTEGVTSKKRYKVARI